MRNLCFLLTLVATLLLPGRLIAAALPQDEKLITGQLDNGLRYMIYPHAHPKDQVNLWLQIHTGSLQEEDNERGVGNDSNLLIVFYVQIMPDDLVMQLHRF